ncbi:hypothetical protein OJAV_G00219110 [Oryzias javanicus]|uniref:Uncharacterized protein n=1 Tax=Oryzias javanicus TaxID=123683 RepID=A0A3S2LY55_ORYJA|nr:hypothetical protein OJAV_G00219110 [Oryzias javanicus]
MEVSSYFASDRRRRSLQLQEPVEHSTPKRHSLRRNTDTLPHRGPRRPLNSQIFELIDREVAKYKSHLGRGSAAPVRRSTADTHSPAKVSVSVPSPSNADSQATTPDFERVEGPRQSPSFQPFPASKQLQEEEDLNDALSEPGRSSAETSSRHSEFPRQVSGTEIKENVPAVNSEPTAPPRLDPAADNTRQSGAKSIRVTSTEQERSRIAPEIAVVGVSSLFSKAAVGTVSSQNKREGSICQISENPGVSTPRRSLQPILYEDISEEETKLYLDKSPCPGLSGAEEDADPCVVLDVDEEDDDDDWEVLPLSILNLQFQPSDKQALVENEGKERELSSRPYANVIPASAFTPMKVFDTPDQQEEAVTLGKLSFVIPPINEHHLAEVESRENFSDPEDCYETEDSNDYSSGPECNLMTVSLQCLRNMSSPSPESNFGKETKEKVTTPGKGWKVEGGKHQNPVIVLDSSDESDDNLELTNHQPAPDESENNHMNQSKVDARPEARDDVSSVDLERTKNYGGNTWKDEGIIILSDSDDDQPQNKPQEATKCSSAASPSQNATADGSAGCPEPETATKESVTKKFKRKRRALPPETQQLEKCPPLTQASPVKMAEKRSHPEDQSSILPQFYLKKRPHQRSQLVRRPDPQRQAEDPSNPVPPPDRCKEDTANQRVKKSVLRSKSHPPSAAPVGQKSVSFSVSSASKPSNSSEGRTPSALLPLNPAKSKVCSDWRNSFFSIRKSTKDPKEGDSRTKTSNLPAEARPRPGRVPKRRNSHESAPLMKKTKLNAMEYTRARNCSAAIDPRYPVGEGYKWKNSGLDGSKKRVGRARSRKHRSESPFSDCSF